MKLPKLDKPKLGGRKGGSRRMPKPVADVYADLRDRRLLPLVALLLVAIVAAPFLLANHDEESPVVAAPRIGTQGADASFAVVPAKQELRNPRKRLGHRKATSPFSTYAAARLSNQDREFVEHFIHEGQSEGSEVSPEAGPEATAVEVESSSEGGAVEAEPVPQVVVPTQPKTTIKAQIGVLAVVRAGFNELREPKRLELEGQERLPSRERPALVYVGPSPSGKGGIFLMGEEVTAYYGHGTCVLGSNPCQEIELRTGKSATFALGYGETRYKIEMLGFEPVIEERTIEAGR